MRTAALLTSVAALAVALIAGPPATGQEPSKPSTRYVFVPLSSARLQRLRTAPAGAGPTSTSGPAQRLVDRFPEPPTPVAQATRDQPQPAPQAVAKAARHSIRTERVAGGLRGRASYYCCTHGYGSGAAIAAAGPALRSAIGAGWRGTVVTVSWRGRSIRVTLADWCQCYKGQRRENVIDLHPGPFASLGPLSLGILSGAVVSW